MAAQSRLGERGYDRRRWLVPRTDSVDICFSDRQYDYDYDYDYSKYHYDDDRPHDDVYYSASVQNHDGSLSIK